MMATGKRAEAQPNAAKKAKPAKKSKTSKTARKAKPAKRRKGAGSERTTKRAARKPAKARARKPAKAPARKPAKAPARKPAKAAGHKRGKERMPAPPTGVVRRATPLGDYWHKLQACGWLDAVPASEHRALRERIGEALRERPQVVFQALATTSLDLECIEGSGPDELCSYQSVLRQLAEASGGRFQPEAILDELDPALGVARISFCLGELSFHREVPYRDEWVQPGIFEMVNGALELVGEPSRFHQLPADGQFAHLAFVSAAVFERAREDGLIPEDALSARGGVEGRGAAESDR
jgi:hypothetical protein